MTNEKFQRFLELEWTFAHTIKKNTMSISYKFDHPYLAELVRAARNTVRLQRSSRDVSFPIGAKMFKISII